jgi:alpha-glucosidase
MRLPYVFCATLLLLSHVANAQSVYTVNSPDGKIKLQFGINSKQAYYNIEYAGSPVLANSQLGLVRDDADFATSLSLQSASAVQTVKDSYTIKNAKRLACSYKANKRVFRVKNAAGAAMDIIFQVSDDGVAFRYFFPDKSPSVKKVTAENTSFYFPAGSKAWLQPISEAKSGWEKTNPSYEEHYQQELAVGTASPTQAGWVFPALFKSNSTWVLITEASVDENYCASRLQQQSPQGEYKIGFPDEREIFAGGAGHPQSSLPWLMPWRIITVGSLKTIIESTLGTDLAKPAVKMNTSFIQPGKASWSWVMLKDDSIVYNVQKRYIDYAADMQWQYCLVDVNWDTKIGYDKIKELADYAATKTVGVWLWYNSSGDWNTTRYHPKSKLLTHDDRVTEFAKLKAMGIRGIKVDFFGGDGQSVMKYYFDILTDAAQFNLMVNFHGATFPRGWQRTYPNLMTMEAVKGFEMITFNQRDADVAPNHCAMLPFTRNAFDPMDFTPMVLYKIPRIRRKTSSAFELALSVVFLSGVQHLAESPAGMTHVPEYVKDFLRQLPVYWEETKFIDGYPGKLAVVARRSGKKWYVSGINGENTAKTLELDLSFLAGKKGVFINDGSEDLSFQQETVPVSSNGKVTVSLKPNGGFVAVF